jgi:sugar lactone lactonase YvrE
MKFKILALLALGCFLVNINELSAELAFVTDYESTGTIYSFDTTNPTVPGTPIFTGLSKPDCITYSPDGKTVYFTSFDIPADVYTFPAQGPYTTATALGTGVECAAGIAISGDGKTAFVTTTSGGSFVMYSFPTGMINPPLTTVTITGATIDNPLFIVISGTTAYVGDYINGKVYSGPITASTYNATLIQTPVPGSAARSVTGLAVSSDGYLYIAYFDSGTSPDGGSVGRVPLTNPSGSLEKIAQYDGKADGLAISSDGTTCYLGVSNGTGLNGNGVYSFPTNKGFQSISDQEPFQTFPAIAIALPQRPPLSAYKSLVQTIQRNSPVVPQQTRGLW